MKVQILTEDGEGAYPALRSLLIKILNHKAFWVSAQNIRFLDAPEQVRMAFRGTNWYGDEVRASANRRLIAKSIATHLASADPGLFVIHADIPWSSGERSPPNHRRVHRLLVPQVSAQLAHNGRPQAAERLVVLVPYAHIESWFFQNTPELRRWYARHHPGEHPDLGHIQRWEADPGQLDEECEPATQKPKHLLVVGSQHNAALAQDFPVDRALSANKSFAADYEALLSVPGLKDWITATKPSWAQESP